MQTPRRPVVRRTPVRRPNVGFPALCRAVGLPAPVPEYRFHPVRLWRMDWAWPDQRIGLEVDGGTWIAGRHTRGSGWAKDTEKLNGAAVLGYRMFRCTPADLASGHILAALVEAFR